MKHTSFSPSHWINRVMHCFSMCMTLRDGQTQERPEVEVVVQNITTKALIDTGADISILSFRKFCKIKPRIKLTQSNIRINVANGSQLTVKGSAILQLRVAEHKEAISQEFLVVQGAMSDCILGSDYLAATGAVLDYKNKKVKMINNIRRDEDHREKDHHEEWMYNDESSIRATEGCTILPNSERAVMGKGAIPTTDQNEVMISALPIGPTVQEGIAMVKEDRSMMVIVANPGDHPRRIKRGQVIARWDAVKKDHIVQVNSIRAMGNENTRRKDPIDENMVNLSAVPMKFRGEYLRVVNKFRDIMSINPNDIGDCKVLPHKIILKDRNKVACTPPYRTPEHLKPVVLEYVSKLLAANIIQKSESPFNSPILLVRKANATDDMPLVEQWRIVHDFRNLNSNTVRDSYPMRNLNEMVDEVAKSKVWAVVDLSSGFWNQRMDPDSRQFTAFGIPGIGHWEYTKSAQGLTNSPAAFQRLLDYVTRGLTKTHVYIDDVITHGDTHEECLTNLEALFERLRKYNIKCRVKKLQLGAPEINYLGYNISQGHGIRPGEAKVITIKNWKPPTDIKGIREFHGLCNFFRRCVPNFSQMAKPLVSLLRKDSGWTSGSLPEPALQAFNKLQAALVQRPCLKPVDFNKEFILTVDASESGLGAVLSQKHEDGEHPCAYASRTLNAAEKKLAPFHLEHLAMVWGCRHFKPYLLGKHHTIRTDHKPLVSLNKVHGQAMDRIRAEMEEYLPYTIEYMKGETNPADGLSRLVHAVHARRENLWDNPRHKFISKSQILHLQKQDAYIKAVACFLKFNTPPTNPNLLDFVERVGPSCTIRDHIVCLNDNDRFPILAPLSLRQTIIYQAHDSVLAGHFGAKKTGARIKHAWYWPGMGAEIENYCKTCPTCNQVNLPHNLKPVPLQSLEPPKFFNDRVHFDLMGPLPLDGGHKWLMVVIDAFSKWVELIPLSDKQAETTANAFFSQWICRYGVPRKVVSDRGTEFACSEFDKLASTMGFDHSLASRGHAQSNGLVERENRTIIAYWRKYLESSNNWTSLLQPFAFAYNSAVHSSTKISPFFMVFGQRPRVCADATHANDFNLSKEGQYSESFLSQKLRTLGIFNSFVHDQLLDAFDQQKADFDKRARSRALEPGDRVYCTRPHTGKQFQKFQPLYHGPFTVVKLVRNNNYLLRNDANGKLVTIHINRLKLSPFPDQLYTFTTKMHGLPEKPDDNDTEDSGMEEADDDGEEDNGAVFDDDVVQPQSPTLGTTTSPPTPPSPPSSPAVAPPVPPPPPDPSPPTQPPPTRQDEPAPAATTEQRRDEEETEDGAASLPRAPPSSPVRRRPGTRSQGPVSDIALPRSALERKKRKKK